MQTAVRLVVPRPVLEVVRGRRNLHVVVVQQHAQQDVEELVIRLVEEHVV